MFAPLRSETETHLGAASPLPQAPVPASARVKRCRDGSDELRVSSSKRAKLGAQPSRHRPTSPPPPQPPTPSSVDARDIIRHQFGLEVLLKHSELRLVNQELAKCQVALEQLRRCHLIPYPQSCSTPDQMLDISSGTGPALANPTKGEPTPRWAPPFGVVDGPYARHYAKWLIPDPVFDGPGPRSRHAPESCRQRATAVEGRATRNSFAEPSKSRSARSVSGQKLQALSNGYHLPKDKGGPCILKRADGTTVKLVCLDCHREDFSSTQGFINHCRIAHRRDFKSHGEAAVQSGHPIQASDATSLAAAAEKPPPPTLPAPSRPSLVHPFAQHDMTEQQAYVALRARINDSLRLYHAGKLPGVLHIPSGHHAPQTPCSRRALPGRDATSQTPNLSRLMETRNFPGNLGDIVADAKTKLPADNLPLADESDDGVEPAAAAPPVRTSVAMRVPARSVQSRARRPTSSKGRLPLMTLTSTAVLSDEDTEDTEESNSSPNTAISNVAPSLVSDDGDYDDTDEGSSVCGASDHLDGAAVSDLVEMSLDEDHEPRALRRGSGGVTAPMKLHKDEAKPVTIVSPVRRSTKGRRPRRRV
ncbi:ADA HAT complex component 1 [Ophiocordyceps camponoti-floridani]|uniref:ADA HAT complex component 1 n=1 Tax=Ophiocordyceps camponoti-floridani TaxID=2030778 RepID=A0A8H4VFB4_9HYPO|nr:ADA HAT complex component 1 [Ophiocordyceps camponoti-floridani]